MRTRFAVVLSLILCFAIAALGTSRSPLSADEMKFVYQGRTYAGDQSLTGDGKDAFSPEDFVFSVSCMFDTGGVDVGFAIDSTGSMGSHIAGVRATIGNFAMGLDTAGYDARYGACPFGDSTSGMWDFDPSTPHPYYEMTDDITAFQTNLAGTGAWGGGDAPEDYLSALVALMRYYDWRPTAMKIIIGFIDAVFCEVGDPCTNCRAHYTKEEVLDELLDGGFILFNITRDPPYWGSCVPAAPYHLNWYQSSADATGGSYYSFATPWTTIFDEVITFIRDYQSISVAVTNTSSSTIYDVTGELIAGPCFELISPPEPRDSILPGATVTFTWRFEPFDPVDCPIDSTSDFCFLTVFHSTDGTAPLPDMVTGGCVFFGEDCGCNGTIAQKQFPPDYAITSCSDQFVRYSMSSKCVMDEESFLFKVNSGTGWVIYPWDGDGMTMLADTGFIWAPEDTLLFFSHGDTVLHELYEINDVSGLGLSERPTGAFIVDLEPPVFDAPYPEDGAMIGGPPANVRIDVYDDISGVDATDGWWMTINGVEIPTSDPNLTFDGARINLAISGAIAAMFPPGDSIEVCVGAQDSPDLCAPNVSSTCWSFIIDFLDFDLPKMTVEPNDTFLLPIITYSPHRFSLRDFSVSFSYNPNILGFIGTATAGSALPGGWTTGVDAVDGIATVWGNGTGTISAVDTLIFLRA
ncbi:MAG TPA: hypothetical protein ENN07_02095, partial [candidate division Zixibacteria bacterium]|nr:hypothetical protein [candidate division Zixibacteria bacterium]